MNTAIIGCGLIANMHVQAIQSIGQKLSIVIDHNLAKAREFAKQYGVSKWAVDYQDALVDNIDCVHICTPPALHYEMIKAALFAGKHVICEKPLVLKNKQAVELFQLAQEKHLIHAVNFNVRFYEACKEAQQIIQSQSFGQPLIIHGSYQQEYHIPPTEASWRYNPELAGPMRAVTEIGSHWIDLARYLTGFEVEKVSASFANFSPDRIIQNDLLYKANKNDSDKIIVDSEDAAIISLQFSNKAIGTVLLSEISHGRSNALAIEVIGENGSIWWNAETPNQITQAAKPKGVSIKQYAFSGAYPETFSTFFKAVYDQISDQDNRRINYPTFRDGLINTMICNAIYESAQNNAGWVPVPTIPGE